MSWASPFQLPDPVAPPAGQSPWTLQDFNTTSPFTQVTQNVGEELYDYRYSPRYYERLGSAYDPKSGSGMYDPLSSFGWKNIGNDIDQWTMINHPELFDFNNTGSASKSPMTSLGGDWASVDQWNAAIIAAANATGVSPNLIKAVMKLESNGENLPINGANAVGPMQVVTTYWSNLGLDLYDPAQNIMAGATILKQNYDQFKDWALQNGVDPWKAAVYAYYAGNPYDLSASDNPSQGGSGMSTGQYGDTIWTTFQQLNASGGGTGSGGTGFGSIFGGQQFPITQEMGGNAMDYSNYDWTLGVKGHPGIDIGAPRGTSVYAPVGGTVIVDGGTGYFLDDYGGNATGTGELRIQLDNGDQIVFGHMASINTPVGTRINAGQLVGTTGTAGSGPHLHAEYLQNGASTQTGSQAIDIRTALGMGVGGSGTTDPRGNNVVQTALSFVGKVPYVWGGIPGKGDDPLSFGGWDCSGFTYWLDQNYGTGDLPMGSHDQYQYAQQTGKLFTDPSQLQAGDLVFFDTGNMAGGGAELNRAGHVAMYIGDGQIVQAANPAQGTIVSSLSDYMNMYAYLGGMRMSWSGGGSGYTGPGGTNTYIAGPGNWTNFMRAAALGLPIAGPGYTPGYSGSAFGSWLRQNSPWMQALPGYGS